MSSLHSPFLCRVEFAAARIFYGLLTSCHIFPPGVTLEKKKRELRTTPFRRWPSAPGVDWGCDESANQSTAGPRDEVSRRAMQTESQGQGGESLVYWEISLL